MKNSLEKNNDQNPHHVRRALTWLVVLIIILVAGLIAIEYFGQSDTPTDPDAAAAQFLQDNTRADISEQDITNAGEFLQQTTEPIPEQQIQDLNAFLDNQSS